MTAPVLRLNFARARCVALDGAASEWIELIPAGPDVAGADGRAWTNDAPDGIVAAFNARHVPLVIDWEHATEHRAPNGLDAPAAGWVHRVEDRGGAIWGRVEWTEKAAAQIASREYRFLSPVFLYDKRTRRIVALTSAGLTNTPNLTLTALNREESPVSLLNALRVALDLSGEPDEEQCLSAVRALKADLSTARNRAQTPPPDKFIPRADYDAALNRASNAEQKLQTLEAEKLDAQIGELIEKAMAERKISPATKDYYAAMCKTDGGLDAFKTFVDKAPALLGAESGLESKKPPGGAGAALNAELQQVAAMFGNSVDDLRKYGGLN
ncbi:MAG: phage protease [Candidatus Competibacter sp.]|jgi:phage I-like protein